MKTNLELKREKTDKIIANNFKTSCMNNAKWVKLLDALIKNDHLIPEILLKLVWDENLRKLHLDGTTSWNFDYYPKAMESMVSGRPYGWYAYKEIEWIEFQNNGPQLQNF